MSIKLSPLYHWSPASRYHAIRREGLQPASSPTVAAQPLTYLCLGASPARAWSISGAMDYVSEVDDWDLWQVVLADTDSVAVRPDFGPYVIEVMIKNVIPPDRLWWAGRRPQAGVPL